MPIPYKNKGQLNILKGDYLAAQPHFNNLNPIIKEIILNHTHKFIIYFFILIKQKDKIIKLKEISYGFSNVKSFKSLYFGVLWCVKEFVKYLLDFF